MAKTREEQIVFQNQSHLVQKYFENCGICPTLMDICLGTDLMVRFVNEGYNADLAKRFEAYEKYITEQHGSKK